MDINQILIKPLITEKSLSDVAFNYYTFVVPKSAGKKEIKKAVEKYFPVHVVSVKTAMIRGKKRLVGKRRVPVRETDLKKAMVQLKKGEKIGIFTSETAAHPSVSK